MEGAKAANQAIPSEQQSMPINNDDNVTPAAALNQIQDNCKSCQKVREHLEGVVDMTSRAARYHAAELEKAQRQRQTTAEQAKRVALHARGRLDSIKAFRDQTNPALEDVLRTLHPRAEAFDSAHGHQAMGKHGKYVVVVYFGHGEAGSGKFGGGVYELGDGQDPRTLTFEDIASKSPHLCGADHAATVASVVYLP